MKSQVNTALLWYLRLLDGLPEPKGPHSLAHFGALQQSIFVVTVQRLSLTQSSVYTTAVLLVVCPGNHGIHAHTTSSRTLQPCLQVCDVNYSWCQNFVESKFLWVARPTKIKRNKKLTNLILLPQKCFRRICSISEF